MTSATIRFILMDTDGEQRQTQWVCTEEGLTFTELANTGCGRLQAGYSFTFHAYHVSTSGNQEQLTRIQNLDDVAVLDATYAIIDSRIDPGKSFVYEYY